MSPTVLSHSGYLRGVDVIDQTHTLQWPPPELGMVESYGFKMHFPKNARNRRLSSPHQVVSLTFQEIQSSPVESTGYQVNIYLHDQ